MALLEVSCRHRHASGFTLDLTFTMRRLFTALFGPSGSGKTTVLALVAGFLRPDEGRVRLGESLLLDTASGVCLPPEQRGIGYVFQDALLFPHLTVEENLRYGQRRSTASPGISLTRVSEVLEVGPLLRRYPRHLSGGERQRVALGRALLSGPRLLLMDEPLASLDAALGARILRYVQRVVAEWAVPVLFVTHAQAEVRRAAEDVVVIKNGRLVSVGTPDEALGLPEPLGLSDAAGPMNLLRLEDVRQENAHFVGQLGDQQVYLPADESPDVSSVFVELSPSDVVLASVLPQGLSVRNRLRGTVRKVVPLGEAVFVAVDVGQVLWAEVTPAAVAELSLSPGREVVCLFKAHAMKALP